MRMRTCQRDDGFTVVEVVVAAAILFFVLTAIVGLLGASSSMSVQAKQRAVMTNAVAGYLDDLRVSAWDDITAPGAPVVVVINGVEVKMTITVETREQDDQEIIKIVRVNAVSTVQGKSQVFESSMSILKNPNFTKTLQTDPDAPIVFFTSEAPPDDDIVWGDQSTSGPLVPRTKAFSPGDKIKEVTYSTSASVYDPFAVFTLSPMVQTFYSGPTLNTLTENLEDGFQTVSVDAVDDKMRSGGVKRRYIVDNLPPLDPGAPAIAALSATALGLEWAGARDGGTDDAPTYASHYDIEVSVEPSQTQSTTAPDRVVMTEPRWLAGNSVAHALTSGMLGYTAQVESGTAPLRDRAVQPFSRFEVRLQSSSPRGLTNANWVAARGFTRPELFCEPAPSTYGSTCFSRTWGSGSDKGSEYQLTLFVSRAGFQRASDSPKWEIEYQSGVTTPTPTGWQSFAVPSSSTHDPYTMRLTATRKFAEFTDGRPMFFRVKVSGYNARRGGTVVVPTMYTNYAGPSASGTGVGVTTNLSAAWD